MITKHCQKSSKQKRFQISLKSKLKYKGFAFKNPFSGFRNMHPKKTTFLNALANFIYFFSINQKTISHAKISVYENFP